MVFLQMYITGLVIITTRLAPTAAVCLSTEATKDWPHGRRVTSFHASHTAAVCRRTDTGHTANGGHVTKFQGGDTNGSGCVAYLWHYALTKTQTDHLEALQKRAIQNRPIFQSFTRGMPYNSILFVANLTSLAARREMQNHSFLLGARLSLQHEK